MSEGNVYEELLSSGPFAIIELFELKTFESMHGSDNEYYFHAGRNRKTTEPSNTDDILSAYSIYYDGHTYLPLPIEASGFEFKGDGGLPRPTIRVANLNSNITQLLLGVNEVTPGNDLNGAQVTRIRTMSRFLDGSNWENGVNPYGSPDNSAIAQMPKEVYYIDRKVTETRDFVEFEMVSSLDLANARAPRRLVMQNLCQWKYRGKECGYTGTADFTPVGQTVTYTSAANYTYTSGADKLLAGNTLAAGQSLVSSNGYFTAVMQQDGSFVTYTKPEPVVKYFKWSTGTIRPLGDYVLVMQNDGNLVIYNNDLDRNDYEGGSVIWASDTHRVGSVQSAALVADNAWWPDNIRKGRAAAFGWEIAGSTAVNADQEATGSRTFSETHPEFGTRSVTITFTVRSQTAATGVYFEGADNGFTWNEGTGGIYNVNVTGSTGNWKDKEVFVAKLNTSSGNPYRSNHPDIGTMTEVGLKLVITTTGYTGKQLRLQDDGNLVISDTDGSDVTWSSGFSMTTEPEVEETITAGVQYPPDVVGQCGKTLDDCKLRFGSGDLPFGSFPSVGQNN